MSTNTIENMIKVKLVVHPDLGERSMFKRIRESLTRIGRPEVNNIQGSIQQRLFSQNYLLHKGGEFFITHSTGLNILDGVPIDCLNEDELREQAEAAKLLRDWNLIEIVQPDQEVMIDNIKVVTQKVLKASDVKSRGGDWDVIPTYLIGSNKESPEYQAKHAEFLNSRFAERLHRF